MVKRYVSSDAVVTTDGNVLTPAQVVLFDLETALEQDFDKLNDLVPEDGIEYERAHLETGPGFQVDCWCEMGRDHTFDEWVDFESN